METIDGIVREMLDVAHLAPSAVENGGHLMTDWFYDDECQGWLTHYADRIKAAHKSEVAELRCGIAELLDALQSIYDEECTSYGADEVYNKWRKALEETK